MHECHTHGVKTELCRSLWGKIAPRCVRALTSRLSLRAPSEGVCASDPMGTSFAALSVSASSMAMA